MPAVRFSPVPYDHLVIPQGGTFVASWFADDAETGTVAEWDGWSARMQVRTSFGGDVLATLASSGTADGTIALLEDGNVTATLPSDFTESMSPGRAVFDLEFTDPDGAVWRVVEGAVTVTPEVTANV